MDTAVVWFRRDLRLHDNEPLSRALADAETVVPIYVFDPDEYADSRYVDVPKTGPYRASFVRESVADLRALLRARGGDLLVRHGDPAEHVPAVVDQFDADAVYAGTAPSTDERAVETATRAALEARGAAFEQFWTHTLYHVDDLPTPVDAIDDTFTPWRKEVERNATVRDALPTPTSVPTPSFEQGDVPTADALGVGETTLLGQSVDSSVDDRAAIAFRGGASAGRKRLQQYVWDDDNLRRYKQTRNGLLGSDFSSKLSAWLSLGCLSPRYVYEETKRYESERVANDSTYWLVFELLWRDFFQFQFRKHGASFYRPQGIRGGAAGKQWRHDETAFRRWARGETGVPFVDANVRELNETGYMSNRGRQNVASFLTDVLGVDWRWGAAYFESLLADYDPASNWGNWAYQAGVGNDSRDNHFDVLSQADRYDANAEYVTHWLPELSELPPEYAHRPWRLSETAQAEYGVHLGVDYPTPMLDVEEWYRTH